MTMKIIQYISLCLFIVSATVPLVLCIDEKGFKKWIVPIIEWILAILLITWEFFG